MSTFQSARRVWLAILAVPSVLGCTAVGAWVYDDPTFALRSAQLHPRRDVDGMADSLELVFVACNRNDYEVRGDDFETRLAVAGRTVGEGMRDRPLYLGMRDTARFSVTVPVQNAGLPAGKGDRFELTAQGRLFTPMGSRSLAVKLHGRIEGASNQLVWRQEGSIPCRPGLSVLPNQFSQPTLPDHGIRNDPPPQGPGMSRPGDRP